MKVNFFEGDFGSDITLTPETVEESTKLARTTLNAKRVPVELRMYLNKDGSQSFSVWIKKIDVKVQNNTISNKK